VPQSVAGWVGGLVALMGIAAILAVFFSAMMVQRPVAPQT
jgi:hypothetical protein